MVTGIALEMTLDLGLGGNHPILTDPHQTLPMLLATPPKVGEHVTLSVADTDPQSPLCAGSETYPFHHFGPFICPPQSAQPCAC